ncbi:uncharacterized protein ASPGLDRAFT_1206741 [Aspergillus glaucus CBS 516.65]|uniref:Uncharacterized protein n=1 Tax=Aspergillus glaucus CBS 516.65 TaxID=1160497 RepID=A0A1L9V430_ASPGL|nr:hypothetical protein ASPGLDRAFT_1206741 [Aspergillus glaucus CBS 516.65]OJJ78599.1 hypothetical protein ASPGLDRAFT_1206741 [Aspergillus glaucus CBS 516.65]
MVIRRIGTAAPKLPRFTRLYHRTGGTCLIGSLSRTNGKLLFLGPYATSSPPNLNYIWENPIPSLAEDGKIPFPSPIFSEKVSLFEVVARGRGYTPFNIRRFRVPHRRKHLQVVNHCTFSAELEHSSGKIDNSCQ